MGEANHQRTLRISEAAVHCILGFALNGFLVVSAETSSGCSSEISNFILVTGVIGLLTTTLSTGLALFPDQHALALLQQSHPVDKKSRTFKGLRNRCNLRMLSAMSIWVLSAFLFFWIILGNIWTLSELADSKSFSDFSSCTLHTIAFVYMIAWDAAFIIAVVISSLSVFKIPLFQ